MRGCSYCACEPCQCGGTHDQLYERIAELEAELNTLRAQCWKVAELATEDRATEKWSDEDKGDYCTDLLMRAGFDVMAPVKMEDGGQRGSC